MMDRAIYCYNNHKMFFDENRTCDYLAVIFILDTHKNNVYAICDKCLFALPLRHFEQTISKEDYAKYKKAELLL
jgi:hypothetical protein